MSPAEAMKALDHVVVERAPEARYTAALTLYSAVVAGLLMVPITQATLYEWVLKWATVPEAIGQRSRS